MIMLITIRPTGLPRAARLAVCAACLAVCAAATALARQADASTRSGTPTQADASTKASRPDPFDALRSARMIFIRSHSAFFNPRSLEQALVNRNEFQDWELVVTRNESEADLVIEVSRKSFTNRFVYNVIDRRANRILAGGRIGSLGGTVESQIADSFIKKLRRVRAGGRPTNED